MNAEDMPKDDEVPTSDEEKEWPGRRRPKYGEGWWGHGRPLRAQKKGLTKDFTDGAGLPSPGRWRIHDRRLPNHDVARALKKVLREAILGTEADLPGGSLRSAVIAMAGGGLTENPFPSRGWTT